ncbi:Hypothetical protein SMAX5B_011649, partial [Scophthalmus maximus]
VHHTNQLYPGSTVYRTMSIGVQPLQPQGLRRWPSGLHFLTRFKISIVYRVVFPKTKKGESTTKPVKTEPTL